MKNFTYKLFILIVFTTISSHSQSKISNQLIRCATDENTEMMLEKYPEMMGSQVFENKLKSLIKANKLKKSNNSNKKVVLTIPVVVHIFHNGENIGTGANITDAQVESQIAVLNIDYRNLAGSSQGVAADIELEFCLARKTPTGCPTNGVDRVDIGQNGISETSESNAITQMNALKLGTNWDASQYLNMWTVAFNGGSGILGYAQPPGGGASTDGVVADCRYFGSSDYDDGSFILKAPFDLGRTITHEVGHFFSLFHTFQGGCGGSGDQCADTPAVSSANSGCAPNTSCGSADMIENYMDYTDDACMDTFTLNQKDRIDAIMSSPTNNNRKELVASLACNPPASVNYDGSILIEGVSLTNCNEISPKIRLTNYGTITLTSATITYNLDGGSSTNYSWSGSLVEGEKQVIILPTTVIDIGNHDFNVMVSNPNGNSDLRACNDTETLNFDIPNTYDSTTQVHLELIPDDYGSETTWEFRDSSNALLYSGGPYIDGDNTAVTESFDVDADECYSFTILDSFGDGLCCDTPGSYTLSTDDLTTIFNGSQFGSSETTNISTLTLGIDEYFKNNRVSIYPNPTTNSFTIKLGLSNDLPDSYVIYNTLGQLVKTKTIDDMSQLNIDSSRLGNGFYFIKITKESNSITIPFVKK